MQISGRGFRQLEVVWLPEIFCTALIEEILRSLLIQYVTNAKHLFPCTQRSVVEVKWRGSSSTNIYRNGHLGKVRMYLHPLRIIIALLCLLVLTDIKSFL